jgi:hypothetical protein
MALYGYNPKLRFDAKATATKGEHQLLKTAFYDFRSYKTSLGISLFGAEKDKLNTIIKDICLSYLSATS